jgi:hypothetical protein
MSDEISTLLVPSWPTQLTNGGETETLVSYRFVLFVISVNAGCPVFA